MIRLNPFRNENCETWSTSRHGMSQSSLLELNARTTIEIKSFLLIRVSTPNNERGLSAKVRVKLSQKASRNRETSLGMESRL